MKCTQMTSSNTCLEGAAIIFNNLPLFDGDCTDQVIGCDDMDKRKVDGQEVNVVAVCRSGVLQYK